MTFVTSLGLQIETSGAALQTLGLLLHQDKVLPTAQTVAVAATQTLVTGRVAPITHHGAGVAKVTAKKREVQCVCVCWGWVVLKLRTEEEIWSITVSVRPV